MIIANKVLLINFFDGMYCRLTEFMVFLMNLMMVDVKTGIKVVFVLLEYTLINH